MGNFNIASYGIALSAFIVIGNSVDQDRGTIQSPKLTSVNNAPFIINQTIVISSQSDFRYLEKNEQRALKKALYDGAKLIT